MARPNASELRAQLERLERQSRHPFPQPAQIDCHLLLPGRAPEENEPGRSCSELESDADACKRQHQDGGPDGQKKQRHDTLG